MRPARPYRSRDVVAEVVSAGVTELALSFSAPALPDLFDDGVRYTLGVEFQVSSSVPCVGVDWRVPTTAPAQPSRVSLWDPADSSRLATKVVDYAGQGGTTVRTRFDTPFTLSANTAYRVSVLTEFRYVATTNDTWPKTTGIITATADNGWLASDSNALTEHFPDTESGNSANFHVSPVVQVAA
jgi:hypothetical protein